MQKTYGNYIRGQELDTASANVVLTPPCTAIYVGASGNLDVEFSDGTEVSFIGVPVGVFPIGVVEVKSSSAANSLVALF